LIITGNKIVFITAALIINLKKQCMKKIGIIMLIAFFTACNNSGYDSTKTDSAAAKDNTNMYDTGVGSSMTDTAQRRDSVIPNRMQDTSVKK